MRSDQLTGDQVAALSAKVRPMLRAVKQMQADMDHELEPQDPLRLATITVGNALQDLLTELHYLTVEPGSAGKARP